MMKEDLLIKGIVGSHFRQVGHIEKVIRLLQMNEIGWSDPITNLPPGNVTRSILSTIFIVMTSGTKRIGSFGSCMDTTITRNTCQDTSAE
jgi:hypothetical protein